jgi:hypothetical protein
VELRWKTTDERNNAGFTIERAGRDQKFISIGNIPGMINYSGIKNYFFTDESPLADVNYYRLVQTDIDGQKNIFEIKKVMNLSGLTRGLVVSPNPFMSEISAFVKLDRTQKLVVTLTDMTGKLVKSVSGHYTAGTTEIKIQSNDVLSGVYLLKVSGENFSASKKVVRK